MNQQNKHIKVIISGGGTGGHIFPALSIANEIKKRYPEADILFVGAKGRMEMEKIPANGYPIEGLWISGINRKKMWKNIAFPFKLISSLWNAKGLIKKFKPDMVIGTGGFASGPILYAAQKNNIPTFIQEQNSYPGITNKLLAKKAQKIYTAYDGLDRFFNPDKIVKTGNPIRKDFYDMSGDKTEALKHFDLKPGYKTILSLGGSLGARPINDAIADILNQIRQNNYQLIWQTGQNDYQKYKNLADDKIKIVPFISDMKQAYSAADVIISRAGAGTISELAVVGKPVILVPSPYVAEDHQTKNAQALAKQKAAILLPEKKIKAELWPILNDLLNREEKAQELSQNIKKMALPNATEQIVNDIFKTINK
jgi:UDP-N-acetylglucosamine--N-acetylmuramyl-(pentapeptide) pyrophosphoryl-undecaprenol N-acetylglucosamine transferase